MSEYGLPHSIDSNPESNTQIWHFIPMSSSGAFAAGEGEVMWPSSSL